MNTNNIEIQGIAPQSEFPVCPPNYPCSQICQIDKLFLSCQHEIQKILKVIVNVTISSFKVINTPIGKKVIVHGFKHIKVISVVDGHCHCTHSACFDIPFCLFIKLKDFGTAITKICAIVEDISVQCLKKQFLLVSTVIFVCPIFRKDPKPPDCQEIITYNCNQGGSQSDCSANCSCNCCESTCSNSKSSSPEFYNHYPNCPLCNHPSIPDHHTYQSYCDDR